MKTNFYDFLQDKVPAHKVKNVSMQNVLPFELKKERQSVSTITESKRIESDQQQSLIQNPEVFSSHYMPFAPFSGLPPGSYMFIEGQLSLMPVLVPNQPVQDPFILPNAPVNQGVTPNEDEMLIESQKTQPSHPIP